MSQFRTMPQFRKSRLRRVVATIVGVALPLIGWGLTGIAVADDSNDAAPALKGAIVKHAVYTRRFGSATNAPAVRLAEARESAKVEAMAASYHHRHPYYAAYRGGYGGWGYRPYYAYRPYYYGYRPYYGYGAYYRGYASFYRPSYGVGVGIYTPYAAYARPPIYSYGYPGYAAIPYGYGAWYSAYFAPSYGSTCYHW